MMKEENFQFILLLKVSVDGGGNGGEIRQPAMDTDGCRLNIRTSLLPREMKEAGYIGEKSSTKKPLNIHR